MNFIKLSSPPTKEYWEIPVLFEDPHLLALAKPARLLVSPDRYDPSRPNLMKLLQGDIERGASWVRERQVKYLANAHRLDFETSGVLLLAKDKSSLTALVEQFSGNKLQKNYIALVHGVAPEPDFTVDAKLSAHPARLGVMRIDPKRGKAAITHFTEIERFRGFELLRCRPLTGRTHQIRVHLLWVKLPIVGDDVYGGRDLFLSSLKPDYRLKGGATERPLIGRVALHAEKLSLRHPVTGDPITITAPWPKDLLVAVKYLRRYRGLSVAVKSSA